MATPKTISRTKKVPRDVCEVFCIDRTRVASVKSHMVPEPTLCNVAEIFKALGDPTRAKIIAALSINELCVCDIAAVLGTTKSAVSHQLRRLRSLRIVACRREGKIVHYRLDDEHVASLFSECLRHVTETE